MKKFLLALTLIAMLVCVFTIAVNAEDRTSISYTDINGVTHDVPIVKYNDATANDVVNAIKLGDSRQHNCSIDATNRIADNGSYAIVMDSNGELTAYPSWYMIDAIGGKDYAEVYEIGYGYLNTKSGKSYSDGAIRYIEFPNGMTSVRANSVFGGSNNGYEQNVTHMYIPASVTVIKNNSLAGAVSLKYIYVAEGSQMTVIADEAISVAKKLEYFQFENLTLLTEIDGFRECTALSCDVDLSKCTGLKTIGGTTFYGTNIGKVTLPNSVESIGDRAFASTKNAYLASSYLPTNLKTIGTQFFAYNNNLLETYIFPDGFKSIGNEPFQDSKVAGGPSGKELNLVFLGEMNSVVYLNGNGHQKHAEKVTVYFAQNSRDQYNSNGFYIKPSGSSVTSVPGAIRAVFCKGTGAGTNGSVTGVEYIYITNVNGSVYTDDMVNDSVNGFDFDNHTHYGSRIYEENTCAKDGYETISCIICDKDISTIFEATGDHNYVDGVCDVCGKSYCTSGTQHILTLDVIYENGFLNAGIIANRCQSEGCTYFEKLEDIEAMFTTLGYSAPENGMGGIAIGFTVNSTVVEQYESITGKTVNYGVFVVSKEKLGTDNVFDENGVAASGAITADVTKYGRSAFDIKITGFETETHKSTKLAMGAYVATSNEESTEYAYMQVSEANEGEKYHFASFNDIIGNK